MMFTHPTTHFIISPSRELDYKPVSKWCRRRGDIIDRMKRRKVIINYFLKWICIVVSCLSVSAIILFTVGYFRLFGVLNGGLVGFILFSLWVMLYMTFDNLFETDSYFIHIKHRGRIL